MKAVRLYYRDLNARLILRAFALSSLGLARLRRANNLVCLVEQALRACSTRHTKSGERRRREPASGMAIIQTLNIMYIRRCTTIFLIVATLNLNDETGGLF